MALWGPQIAPVRLHWRHKLHNLQLRKVIFLSVFDRLTSSSFFAAFSDLKPVKKVV